MGFLRQVQPESAKPCHCQLRLGQVGQGQSNLYILGHIESLQGLYDATQFKSICYFRAWESEP